MTIATYMVAAGSKGPQRGAETGLYTAERFGAIIDVIAGATSCLYLIGQPMPGPIWCNYLIAGRAVFPRSSSANG